MIKNEERLKQVMADIFQVSPSDLNEDSSVDNVATWDSLHHMQLVLALEDEFKISFSEEQMVEIVNFALIQTVLKEHGVSFT